MSFQFIKPTLFEIGTVATHLNITEILYVAARIAGSGPGGDQVAFRTVPNTVTPIGELMFHKWWEIIIAFDRDMYTALFNTDVESGAGTGTAIEEADDNTPIELFRITLIRHNGSMVTWTWTQNTTFVANYNERITTEGEDHQPCEVKFISRGERVVAVV
jgi:hypothetical protein